MPPQSAPKQQGQDALIKVFIPQGYLEGTGEARFALLEIVSELAKTSNARVHVIIVPCESYGEIPGHQANSPTHVEIRVAPTATGLTYQMLEEATLTGLEKHGVPRGHICCG